MRVAILNFVTVRDERKMQQRRRQYQQQLWAAVAIGDAVGVETIRECIEFHRAQGVQRILVYGGASPIAFAALAPYIAARIVERIVADPAADATSAFRHAAARLQRTAEARWLLELPIVDAIACPSREPLRLADALPQLERYAAVCIAPTCRLVQVDRCAATAADEPDAQGEYAYCVDAIGCRYSEAAAAASPDPELLCLHRADPRAQRRVRDVGTATYRAQRGAPVAMASLLDWRWYVARYVDLRVAGIATRAAAERHWLDYGRRERRHGNAIAEAVAVDGFDWWYYVRAHAAALGRGAASVRGSMDACARHWLTVGKAAGLTCRVPSVDDAQAAHARLVQEVMAKSAYMAATHVAPRAAHAAAGGVPRVHDTTSAVRSSMMRAAHE